MNKYFIVLLLAVFMLSACTADFSSEEFQAKLIEANTDLETYSIDMTLMMTTSVHAGDKVSEVKTEISSMGLIDRNNQAMDLSSTIKTNSLGMTNEIESQTYVFGNILYSGSMGQWFKQTIDEDIWAQQDQIAQTIELLESGSIELLDDEVIDGTSYYVVNIIPDQDKLSELMAQQSELLTYDMDYSDAIKGYSTKIWVNKKTFVIERSSANMLIELSSENMGDLYTGDFDKLLMESKTDVVIGNINEPVLITPIPELADAVDLSELINAQAQVIA